MIHCTNCHLRANVLATLKVPVYSSILKVPSDWLIQRNASLCHYGARDTQDGVVAFPPSPLSGSSAVKVTTPDEIDARCQLELRLGRRKWCITMSKTER